MWFFVLRLSHHTLEGRAGAYTEPYPGTSEPAPRPSAAQGSPSRAEGWSPPVSRSSAWTSCLFADMPQGHQRALAHRRRAILRHGRPLFSRKGPKASIATWNLRRLGQGNWEETTWLKLKKMTSLAIVRGWRAVLISDCYTEGKGTFSFRGTGGTWLVVYNGRCGILLDPGIGEHVA